MRSHIHTLTLIVEMPVTGMLNFQLKAKEHIILTHNNRTKIQGYQRGPNLNRNQMWNIHFVEDYEERAERVLWCVGQFNRARLSSGWKINVIYFHCRKETCANSLLPYPIDKLYPPWNWCSVRSDWPWWLGGLNSETPNCHLPHWEVLLEYLSKTLHHTCTIAGKLFVEKTDSILRKQSKALYYRHTKDHQWRTRPKYPNTRYWYWRARAHECLSQRLV